MPTEAEIVESVTTAIEGCLTLPILERHKRDIISGLLWKITEARGKYTTRYRSRASMDLDVNLQHDHVFTRKDITDQLIEAIIIFIAVFESSPTAIASAATVNRRGRRPADYSPAQRRGRLWCSPSAAAPTGTQSLERGESTRVLSSSHVTDLIATRPQIRYAVRVSAMKQLDLTVLPPGTPLTDAFSTMREVEQSAIVTLKDTRPCVITADQIVRGIRSGKANLDELTVRRTELGYVMEKTTRAPSGPRTLGGIYRSGRGIHFLVAVHGGTAKIIVNDQLAKKYLTFPAGCRCATCDRSWDPWEAPEYCPDDQTKVDCGRRR